MKPESALKQFHPKSPTFSDSSNRKPFYEGLTGKYHIEESHAESWFEQLTR
ncbi:hypothetical protein ACISK3_02885 [Morganella morganii]